MYHESHVMIKKNCLDNHQN